MKITIREKKLKNGKCSLYLEYYFGTDVNGKVKRKRETIDGLQIYQNPKTPSQRAENKVNREIADKILIKTQSSYINKEYGFDDNEKLNADFLEYFQRLTDKRYDSYGNYGSWDSALKHIKKFTENRVVTFKEVDYEFVLSFKNYLETAAVKKNGEFLAKNSQVSYFGKFKASLKEAYKARIINDNPADRVTGIKEQETFREYLDKQEIERLAKTEIKPTVLKDAFLFSCLTGMRFGDIKKLRWSDIDYTNEERKVKLRQEKTKNIQTIYLHPRAVELMGEKGLNELVFHGLKYDNERIKTWIAKAGIDKKITFHCGRHTHATLLITSGADLYVVKEILGHKHITTTQIYAKVVSERTKEAIKKLPNIDINYGL